MTDTTGSPAVAVIGAGYWGTNLIRIFSVLSTCRLVAVCDLDGSRLDAVHQIYPHLRTSMSIDDVLRDPAISATVVATPAESHRGLAERCLRAGKHVFVEKPIATSVADATAVASVARDADRVLLVGHLFLHDLAVRRAIELIGQGTLGDIRYITSTRASMAGTARLDTSIAWDALIHDAYLLPAIVGRAPLRVQATGRGYLSELEDIIFALFDFGDGVLASCQASWYALQKERRIVVVGSGAILDLDGLRPHPLVIHQRRYEPTDERDPQGRRRWEWRDDGSEPDPVVAEEPLRLECQHFVDCVVGESEPLASGDDGVRAVRIIEACQDSLDSGGTWVDTELADA